MKLKVCAVALSLSFWGVSASAGSLNPMPLGSVRLTGEAQEKVDRFIDYRVRSEFAREVIFPEARQAFVDRDDDRIMLPEGQPRHWGLWKGEFWGKLMIAACRIADSDRDEKLKAFLHEEALKLVALQDEDGYLGTYSDKAYVKSIQADVMPTNTAVKGAWCWNLWCRKYTTWGLLSAWKLTGDRKLLTAAERSMDQELALLKSLGCRMIDTGTFVGMPSCSTLKPLLLLYEETGKAAYLSAAKEIVADWKRADNRPPNLLRNASSGAPVADWYPSPWKWAKAYEMMSCFEGLVEYYRVTGEPDILSAAEGFSDLLFAHELNPMMTVGYNDQFASAASLPNGVSEPCDTVHWIRLNHDLWRETGKAKYVDRMELAYYNAFMAAIRKDGRWAMRAIRSHGHHTETPGDNGMTNQHCCVNNLPRTQADVAETVVAEGTDGALYVAFFNDAAVDADFGTREITGGYPFNGGRIRFDFDLKRPRTVKFRIPSWTAKSYPAAQDGWLAAALPAGRSQYELNFDMTVRRVEAKRAPLEPAEWQTQMWTCYGRAEDLVPAMRTARGIECLRGPVVLAKADAATARWTVDGRPVRDYGTAADGTAPLTIWADEWTQDATDGKKSVSVTGFGTAGDGFTKDTAAFQRAIDEVSAAGGGRVTVPAGRYRIGTIWLKSGVDLHLEKGAVLQASADRADYNAPDAFPQNGTSVVEAMNGGHLVLAVEQHDVAITGEGRIEGNAMAFLLGPDGKPWPNQDYPKWHLGIPWRPGQMLCFVECENVRLDGIEIADSPYWSCFLHGCENVTAENLRVWTRRRPFHTHNGDGIDIDCCRHVRVRNCDIDTADDSVTLRCSGKRLKRFRDCEDVEVSDCRLSTPCNAVRLGVGTGLVKDAVLKNLTIRETRTAVNFVSSWGREGGGVSFRNIRFENLDVEAKTFCRFNRNFATDTVFDGIVFENVRGTTERPACVSGSRAHPLGRIVFRNVSLPNGVRAINVGDLRIEGGTLVRRDYTPEEAETVNAAIDAGRYPGSVDFEQTPPRTAVVEMLPGECWWGVANYFGAKMPFDAATDLSVDLSENGFYNQYASLLVSSRGRAIWCDEQCRFEIRNGRITVSPSGRAAVEVTADGKTLREAFLSVATRHFPASGRIPHELFFSAPQYNTWIELTYHQNEKDILAYAQSMLDNGLPPGVLMIDDTWQHAYGEWDFDRRRFDDPKGMVAKLHGMGFKVILWICPWVGLDTPAYRLLAHGRDPDTVVRQPIGGLYRDVSGKVGVDAWWNGLSALVDFTHPLGRAWFKGRLDWLAGEYGVDGFKLDGGALSHYGRGLQPHEFMATGDQANGFAAFATQYPVCEYRHAWKLGGQPIVERLHDKKHTWEDLRELVPALLAGGLLGHPFMCPDMIGGGEWTTFLPGAPFDPELFVRSAQVHALCGMMQFSASPWRVLTDESHRRIVRESVALRQRYAERFLALARECGKSGEPMIRTLEYVFPGCGYERVRDQFMMGDFLLVAPVVEKGATKRPVELPPGTWRAGGGSIIKGPQSLTVEAPLSVLPHFERVP